MKISLEAQTLQFWTVVQKMRRNEFPVISEYARSIELPTLAVSTPFPKLVARIQSALGIETEEEIGHDY